MLARTEALDLVKKHVTRENIIHHMLAVEAIMRASARCLNEDEEKWGLVGLVHDVDYEKTEDSPEKHSLLAEEILRQLTTDEIIRAIKSHNFEHTRVNAETNMEKALIAADAVSGLLIACALVMPSKKIADVRVESVAKKFKDKDFARGANREKILYCEQISIPKEEFFQTALDSLKASASQIGL